MSSQPQSASIELLAPLSGPVVPLELVPDPVFAQKIVGSGLAIDPIDDTLLAPLDGKIVQLHRARHAVTIEAYDGTQVLLHIGLDTVTLNGEGFFPLIKVGDEVTARQPLIRFDSDWLAQKAKSLLSIMVVMDVPETQLEMAPITAALAGQDKLIRLKSPSSGKKSKTPTTAEKVSSSTLLIKNLPTGLHARPAALLASRAKHYVSSIQIIKSRDPGIAFPSANAKSVVGIMGLEIGPGDGVHFEATGPDAKAAVTELFAFLAELREQPQEAIKPKAATPSPRAGSKNVLFGVGVSSGMAVGRIFHVKSEILNFEENTTRRPEQEEFDLQKGLQQAAGDLRALMSEVEAKTDAAIFAAHLELLDDPDIQTEVTRILARGKSAAFAWNQAVHQMADRLANLNNELMANRANDLRDVGRRVLKKLVGSNSVNRTPEEGSILVAESLTPSETVQMDRSKVLGFCTTTGGATSHVAILARSLGLPAIAGMDPRVLSLPEGTEVVLDGEAGEIHLNPSDEEKADVIKVQKENLEHRQAAFKLANESAKTLDGQKVEVAANIGSVEDARQAVEMGADGVGLLRSEFLFLERETAPTEDEQYQVYQEIANILGQRTFVIRTLDVGGDKPLKYLPLEAEENPFLGVRGIRIGFLYPEVFRQQLRAILRVKSKGKLCVMFPMIASIEEFRKAKAILEEERQQLNVTRPEVGIMIEVPSAALAAEELAREADFFSVGTNDLTQYALAMDRGHKGLARLVDALHPSVLKLIKMATEAAHRHGKWIGVCGGLASDLKAVSVLIGLGIDELSVSIPSIPLVKASVRETKFSDACELAKETLQAENAEAVRHLLARNQVK